MNKYILGVIALVIVLGGLFFLTQNKDEPRVSHYVAEDIADPKIALEVLENKVFDIASILKREELEGSDLERIHEISYTLESAIDMMREESTVAVAIIDQADEAIQALHFASERQEEKTVRQWFPQLAEAVTQMSVSNTK